MKNPKNISIKKDPGSGTSNSDSAHNTHEIDRVKASKKYENVDEKEIWEEFKKHSESAFIHIYVKYYSELINFGRQFTNDRSIIEDIIQNLFIHLRERRSGLPKLKSSIRSYLFQCLKRKFFDYKKTAKYAFPIESDTPFEIVIAEDTRMIMEQNSRERTEKLKHSISKLNARQREVIYYYYYKNLSYEEIKTLMDFGNVKSVRNFVYKTVTLLKKFIVILLLFCVN